MTTTKRQAWEAIAVDLVFKTKESQTIALLPCNINLAEWVNTKVESLNIKEPFFIYTYFVTLH